MRAETVILGAGMTGLAAGVASGLPVYEAEEAPGGICSSYYMRPGENKRLRTAPNDEEAYRFEIGGGHWVFGGDALVLRFIRSIVPVKSYARRSSVYFPDQKLFAPYPLQYHLRYLRAEFAAAKALEEMVQASACKHDVTTMADWLRASFGPTLCELFFDPFHQLYTAGLYKSIAPQDAYKSPVDLALAKESAFSEGRPVGYNATFIYPEEGLSTLAQRMTEMSDVRFGKLVVSIDPVDKAVYFADGSTVRYDSLLSTLPLNRMMAMTGLETAGRADPSPSVLVINIGAIKGPNCPGDHWVYIPKSKASFHRVGFYSNVDVSFLPASVRKAQDRVSIYVEKAYPEDQKPGEFEIRALCNDVVQELQEWGWIGEMEVADPTWIEVAYTWSWPGSSWKQEALTVLEQHGIIQVGRYARWVFQGIADSIRDGIIAGATVRKR